MKTDDGDWLAVDRRPLGEKLSWWRNNNDVADWEVVYEPPLVLSDEDADKFTQIEYIVKQFWSADTTIAAIRRIFAGERVF